MAETNIDELSIKFIHKDWNISLHVNERMQNAKILKYCISFLEI